MRYAEKLKDPRLLHGFEAKERLHNSHFWGDRLIGLFHSECLIFMVFW